MLKPIAITQFLFTRLKGSARSAQGLLSCGFWLPLRSAPKKLCSETLPMLATRSRQRGLDGVGATPNDY